MFTVAFYESISGRSDVFDVVEKLEIKARTSKQDRVRFAKIVEYMRLLEKYGTVAGFPVVKYMGNDIWELRPLDDRFFFFLSEPREYVMLNHCLKSKGKTPQKELNLAIVRKKDYLERKKSNA